MRYPTFFVTVSQKWATETGCDFRGRKDIFVKARTIRNIWHLAMKQKVAGLPMDASSKKRNSCGRKRKYDESALDEVKNLELHKRPTLKGLSCHINVPVTSCWRLVKQGLLKRQFAKTVVNRTQ